jgi:spore coat polysaccharide biosynthesis protein SpsF
MRMLGVLQARMTSSRLPGKVLEPILDVPMIGRQIERLQRSSLLDDLVVATSTDPSDDELCDYVSSLRVSIVRGSLQDVLSRFEMAINQFRPDNIVRLTADCPLTSPHVIDEIIDAFLNSNVDYLSNTLQPTFPDGLDVEVVRAETISQGAREFTDGPEREHVTLGIYRRPDQFRVANFSHGSDLSGLRWTVDTHDDLEFVRAVYARLYPQSPNFDVSDILDLLKREPDLTRTTVEGVRNAALIGLDTGAMNG